MRHTSNIVPHLCELVFYSLDKCVVKRIYKFILIDLFQKQLSSRPPSRDPGLIMDSG